MADKELARPPAGRSWTRADEYLTGLARRRTERRRRCAKPRSQPERSQFLLSTLPFIALLAALAVVTVSVMVVAWPGAQPQFEPKPAPRELGTAPRGWFQEAQREFK